MREKNKKELWENTLRALKSSAVSEVRGMESKVFIPLKYSYDCLDPKLQLCFLYCSVFPEDYEISIVELVRYWVFEEELVDGTTTLQEALNKGYNIIERLKDSCLLEGNKESNERFRMHDLIRDLAVWIICSLSSSSSSSQAPKFLIKAGEGLELPPGEKIWESARRISLMKNKLEELQIRPRCSNLVTLLLRDNDRLHFIHDHFFENMCELRILDLSGTDIESLPASLSELKNLRALICQNCPRLEEIPTLKQMEKLQLLDLSKCRIRKLPEGIADLKKLRQLYLDRRSLTTSPCNLICGIKSLEDLTLEGFDDWAATATFREAAANLPRLTTFRICLSSFSGFTADDMNHRFNWEGLRKFEITVGDAALCYDESHMEPYGKIVNIWGLDNLPLWIEGLTRHAEIITIVECERALAHLTGLIGQSRSIRCISVRKFWGLECIIDGGEVGVVDALDWLEILLLCSLHDLRKVFNVPEALQSTCFRKLKQVSIYECHKLKHIFSYSMVENLLQLQELQIQECDGMMEIIEGYSLPALESWFPRLITLVLQKLPELKRICSQRLAFPSIEHIIVSACPELKKLPILCSSIQRVSGEIAGSREWWEGLEWELDDEGLSKSIYSNIYQDLE